MAKVSGPLMSMDASGAFAGALVFGKWKGRNTVRQLVTPANPQSTLQTETRNAMRVMALGQRFANLTAQIRTGETLTDKAELITRAPAGQAWNGYLIKSAIGAGLTNYDAASAAYEALEAGQKTAWDTAAGNLVPAILGASQKQAGGAEGTPMPAGKVFFHYVWGLYMAGATAQPGAVPPTYA